jgi:hypothetical protein
MGSDLHGHHIIVVVLRRLAIVSDPSLWCFGTCATDVNEGYRERFSRLVAFNGERVRNMAHLAEMLEAARREGGGDRDYLHFELDDREQRHIVLSAEWSWSSEAEIRKAHRIPPRRAVAPGPAAEA